MIFLSVFGSFLRNIDIIMIKVMINLNKNLVSHKTSFSTCPLNELRWLFFAFSLHKYTSELFFIDRVLTLKK